MPTDTFWGLAGIGVLIFFVLLPFALSDKWKK
jgi:hypothetical protein